MRVCGFMSLFDVAGESFGLMCGFPLFSLSFIPRCALLTVDLAVVVFALVVCQGLFWV